LDEVDMVLADTAEDLDVAGKVAADMVADLGEADPVLDLVVDQGLDPEDGELDEVPVQKFEHRYFESYRLLGQKHCQ
jgi:trans-aconitate methyltransferase